MNKKQLASIIVISIILSLLINIFFGRYLSVKVSTIPLLNRWKILSPQAPIVINTREEVRVSDAEDIPKLINQVRSKLSGVVTNDNGQTVLTGQAVNLTSDGLFLTAKSVLAGAKPGSLFIKLDDGTLAPITEINNDPATNLAIVKAKASNVATAALGFSRNLNARDRIIFLASTLKNFSPNFQNSFVAQSQTSNYGAILDSDQPRQTFLMQNSGQLLAGEAIANMNGEIVGIWDGNGVVSGDVIKDLVDNYLSNGKFLRPAFGFEFRDISTAETKMLNVPMGAKITKVGIASPAQKAGLKENDIITAVNGTALNENNTLESFLQKYKPGENIKFAVTRGGANLTVNVLAGELK